MTTQPNSLNLQVFTVQDLLKQNRGAYTIDQILELKRCDARPGTELNRKLREMDCIEYDEKKQTFKYKPKVRANNIGDIVKIIKDRQFKGVKRTELDDAYPTVEEDLKKLSNEEEAKKYGIIPIKDDGKGKEVYFYYDPSVALWEKDDRPTLSQEYISEWKRLDYKPTDPNCQRVVKGSGLIAYHFEGTTSSEKKTNV